MKLAPLKIVNTRTYRLTPYTKGLESLIVGWYDKVENREFFRRCPPICDWLSPEGVAQVFGALWVIFEDDTPIGLAGLFGTDKFSRSTEMGVLIDTETCIDRKTAARKIFNQLCDYVYNYLNLHKIYIKIMPWRDKLAKRIEEHGFTKEAELRDSCFYRGEYHSELLYSCLKLEFKEI